MSCGFSQNNTRNAIHNDVSGVAFATGYKTVQLYTAYLGRVSVRVGVSPDPNVVLMECKGSGSGSDIIIREIDAEVARVDPNTMPQLRMLSSKQPAVVNIADNKETFFQIKTMELQRANQEGNQQSITQHKKTLDKFRRIEPDLSYQLERKYSNIKFNGDQLRALYVKNSVVDVHFNTTLYLQFLQEKLNRPSINNSKLLLSICNVRDLDNAFFTGEYMVYGNGKEAFYPLTSIDVGGHELGHGLVQSTAGLEYQSESGALNESFADVLGTAFEFWLYKIFNTDEDKENDLQGESDWLIGEDIGKTMKYLRSMSNPESAKQPSKYKGLHWVDTRDTSDKNDYGGVHSNSGVGNHCFYIVSQKLGIETALSLFYNCLIKLNRRSDYTQFSSVLLSVTPDNMKDSVNECLLAVNLQVGASVPSQPDMPDIPDPSQEHQQGQVPYPNRHIPPTQKCCPHCLCLQQKRRIGDELHPRVLRRSKRRRIDDI